MILFDEYEQTRWKLSQKERRIVQIVQMFWEHYSHFSVPTNAANRVENVIKERKQNT